LVIIGLIIGGILKGQEVITSARQKAVINQINAVRAATNTYFDRYRALPGDDKNATNIDPNLVNGDGNGIVASSGASAGANAGAILAVARNTGEEYQFFNGLVAANLLNGAQVTAAITSTQFGSNSALPASPISGAGLTIIYGTHEGDGTASTAKTVHWALVQKDPAAASVAAGKSISPRQLANIDAQIDDGIPERGGVRGDMTAGCNAAAYVVTDNVTCIAFFEISD
jgi:hypothetical protein